MKVKLIIGGVVILGALFIFFVGNTGKAAPVLYVNPSEYLKDSSLWSKKTRLKGKIVEGSSHLSSDKTDVTFLIGDGVGNVSVHYRGIVPDAFQEGLEVVAEGKSTQGNFFEASDLIVKCPSKYKSKASKT